MKILGISDIDHLDSVFINKMQNKLENHKSLSLKLFDVDTVEIDRITTYLKEFNQIKPISLLERNVFSYMKNGFAFEPEENK